MASLNCPTRSPRRLSGTGAPRSGDYTTPVGGLYAVYPSSRHVSPLVKEFIELAAERLAATGTGEDDKAVAVFNQSFGWQAPRMISVRRAHGHASQT
jgi:hypothetical protein